jgi:glucan phosphoethanolaminetransferase (alkaline phosphatase superfamily)
VDTPNWTRRLLIGGAIVVTVLLGGLIASATIPRWWAQRIADQVDGSITQGTLVGLFYGFLFTFLPMIVLIGILRWKRTWKALVVAVGLALLLASPNLMTLGIVLGTGNAAHAGERTLDVEAPAFRGASLAGALLAVALVGFIGYLLVSRRKARATVAAEHARAEEREPAGDPPES